MRGWREARSRHARGGFCRAATKPARVQRAARGACDAADSARCSLHRWTRRYWSQRDQFHHVLDASALAPSVRHLCRNHPPTNFQAPSERHHPHALPEAAAPTGLRNLFGFGFRQRCRADGAGRAAELRTAWSAVSNVRGHLIRPSATFSPSDAEKECAASAQAGRTGFPIDTPSHWSNFL